MGKRLSPYPNPVDDGPQKWYKLFEEYLEELREVKRQEEQETGERVENGLVC